MPEKKAQQEYHYFRVIVMYDDGETSGNRVFHDRAKADQWAARQEKSPVVKSAKVEEFTPQPRIEHRVRKPRGPR